MTKPKVEITDYTLKVANMIKFESDLTKSKYSHIYYLFTKKNGEWLSHHTLEKDNVKSLGFSKMTAEDIKDFVNSAMMRDDAHKVSYIVTVRKPTTYGNWFSIYGKSGKRHKVTY